MVMSGVIGTPLPHDTPDDRGEHERDGNGENDSSSVHRAHLISIALVVGAADGIATSIGCADIAPPPIAPRRAPR